MDLGIWIELPPTRALRVQVRQPEFRRPSPQQVSLGRRALATIRQGAEASDRQMLAVAAELEGDLGGFGSSLSSESFGSLAQAESGCEPARGAGREGAHEARVAQLMTLLEWALDEGRFHVEEVVRVQQTRKYEPPVAPEPLKPTRETPETFFEVRFMDETGQAVGGFPVVINAAGVHELQASGVGLALLEGVVASSGTVAVNELDLLDKALLPRWERPRTGKAPREGNMQEVVYRGAAIGPLSIKAAVPNTVVIKPPLGKLWVELRHVDGQKLHANTDYEISGPMSLSGTTDDSGRLLHPDVVRGDYELSFKVEEDEIKLPLVVLETSEATPEVRHVAATPGAQLVSLSGFFFDRNKSLPMPPLLAALRRARHVFERHESSELLVVGHTDASGDSSVNDPLSLERAEGVVSLLGGAVDDWLEKYDSGVAAKHRWNESEDQVMIGALPDFALKSEHLDSIAWFQRTRGLKVDGISGPKTRRQLIGEYMALSGVSALELDIKLTAHGCGENFPPDADSKGSAQTSADAKEDVVGRRIELFFFDREFGILPPAPGKNSKAGSSEYPAWRKKAQLTLEEQIPKPALEITLKSPSGAVLDNTEVRVLQGGSVIGTLRSDAAGTLRVSGHDPTQPIELVVLSGSALVTSGGREHDESLKIDAPEPEPVTALEGCELDHSHEEFEASHAAEPES